MNAKRLGVWVPLLVALGCGRMDVGTMQPSATGGAGGTGGMSGMYFAVGGMLVDVGGSGGRSVGGAETGGSAMKMGGQSADGGAPPFIGGLGTSCVPGEVKVEAYGSPGAADVKTLDRCAEGLTCNSAKLCVPTPACDGTAQNDCLVYGTARTDGTISTGTGGSSTGGQSGGSSVPEGVVISGITADGENLYWLNYGTRDRLGNYNNDGALLAYSFQSRATRTVVAALSGPVELEVTNAHAYFLEDGGPLNGGVAKPTKLRRVLLTGETPELVAPSVPTTTNADWHAADGADFFWADPSGVYGIADSQNSPRRVDYTGYSVTVGGGTLYYAVNGNIRRVASDGGGVNAGGAGGADSHPTDFVAPAFPAAVSGDYLYGLEPVQVNVQNGSFDAAVLSRTPTSSGGAWVRIQGLGIGYPYELRLLGNRFFLAEWSGNSSQTSVLTGTFASVTQPARVLERQRRSTLVDNLWVGTASALYWSDGTAIYRRTLAPLP